MTTRRAGPAPCNKRPHGSHLSLLTSHPPGVFLTVFPTVSLSVQAHIWAPQACPCSCVPPVLFTFGLRGLAAGGHIVRSGGKKERKGSREHREGGVSPVVSASPLNPRCYLSKMQHPPSRRGVRPHHRAPTHSLSTRIWPTVHPLPGG